MQLIVDFFAMVYIVVGLAAAAVWVVGEGVLLIMDLMRRR
jgi:hypothetical protein